jgi:hypothetical protein
LDANSVNKWLTLLANIGVLVGIMFLALEIQQSNRIALATTEISVRSQYKTNNELILANDVVAELLVKAYDANAEFSDAEIEKLYAFWFAHVNTWMSIEIAYKNGMLPRTTFEFALEDVRSLLLGYPALQPIARDAISEFRAGAGADVRAAIREVLEDID